MAGSTILSGTEGAALLMESWRPFYHVAAEEERIVTMKFDDATKRISGRLGDILHIGKISRKTAQRQTTGHGDSESLTWNTDTETDASGSMVRSYSGVRLNRDTLARVVSNAKLKDAYLSLMMAALSADIDVEGATLANSLATNIVGGVGQVITGSLLRQALGKILVTGKNKARAGKDKFLCYHSEEHEHVLAIPDVTAADIRGDGMNPVVNGFVWKAYDLKLNHSGNIYQNSGVTHNLLTLDEAFAIAFNEKVTGLEPQRNGLSTEMLTTSEWAVFEVEDAEAVDMQTGP